MTKRLFPIGLPEASVEFRAEGFPRPVTERCTAAPIPRCGVPLGADRHRLLDLEPSGCSVLHDLQSHLPHRGR